MIQKLVGQRIHSTGRAVTESGNGLCIPPSPVGRGGQSERPRRACRRSGSPSRQGDHDHRHHGDAEQGQDVGRLSGTGSAPASLLRALVSGLLVELGLGLLVLLLVLAATAQGILKLVMPGRRPTGGGRNALPDRVISTAITRTMISSSGLCSGRNPFTSQCTDHDGNDAAAAGYDGTIDHRMPPVPRLVAWRAVAADPPKRHRGEVSTGPGRFLLR